MLSMEKTKFVVFGLAIALFSGIVGAVATRPSSTQAQTTPPAQTAQATPNPQPQNPANQPISIQMQGQPVVGQTYQLVPVDEAPAAPVAATRTVTRRGTGQVARTSTQRTYYNYDEAPKKRSFWSRHRDILTVGIGTGAGAAIGGIAGGKKGAAIGALAGAGGSALYTYGLRKRN